VTETNPVAVGDAICRNHQSRTRDLESRTIELGALDSPAKAHRAAALLRKQSENLTIEAQELSTHQAGSIAAPVRAKANLIGEWARAYDDLDTARIQALQARVADATARVRRAARANDFEVCGKD
jgi:hypothetical protein